MPQYMLLYRGPQPDMSAMTPEIGKAVMDQWNAWFGKVGSAMKDGGSPVVPHAHVGKAGATVDVNGYSIVEASDLSAAKALLSGHPHLADPAHSLDILEITPINM